jgi:hypothetical protein
MNFSFLRFTGSLMLLAGATSVAMAGDSVASPVKRQQALERAKAFVAPREIAPVTVEPFYSPAFTEAVAAMGRVSSVPTPAANPGTAQAPAAPTGPRNDHDLLAAIASSLKPSGLVVIGGQPSLSFGQKRVKAGGILTITFEGNQYTLEVVSIDHANFTLRLNREEFTRTIK